MKKRLLSICLLSFLALLMATPTRAATVCKIGSKGYDSVQEAVNAAKNGETVKITKKITTSETVFIPAKSITLNFANKRYVYQGEDFAFKTAPGSTVKAKKLNLEGSSIFWVEGRMTIYSGRATCRMLAMVSSETSSLTVRNGTFVCQCSRISMLHNNGTLKIMGGSFGTVREDGNTDWHTVVRNGGTLTITGGTFDGATECLVQNHGRATIEGGSYVNQMGHCLIGESGSTTEIKNGTFYGMSQGAVYEHPDAKLTIQDGSFTTRQNMALNTNGTAVVNGGTFKVEDEIHLLHSKGGKLTINGGSFYGSAWLGGDLTLKVKGGSFKKGMLVIRGNTKATFTGGKSFGGIVTQDNATAVIKSFVIKQKPSPAGWGDGGSCLIAQGGTIKVKGGKFISENGSGFSQAGGKVVFDVAGDYKKLFQVRTLEYKN